MNEHIPDFVERQALAEQTRRLLRAIRLTQVGDGDRTKASDLLAEATAILERDAPVEPLWHTGLTGFEEFRADTPLNEVFPFSPATGALNPVAPVMDLSVGDDGVIRGVVTFAECHNGPPFDMTHGGAVALFYDELLGLAGMLSDLGGFTASLKVEYRLPTPLLVPIQVSAWTTEPEGRKLFAHGEMRYDGQLLTEASGLFIQPRGATEATQATA